MPVSGEERFNLSKQKRDETFGRHGGSRRIGVVTSMNTKTSAPRKWVWPAFRLSVSLSGIATRQGGHVSPERASNHCHSIINYNFKILNLLK